MLFELGGVEVVDFLILDIGLLVGFFCLLSFLLELGDFKVHAIDLKQKCLPVFLQDSKVMERPARGEENLLHLGLELRDFAHFGSNHLIDASDFGFFSL